MEIKGSVKLWIAVGICALIALVTYVVVPNWCDEYNREATLFLCIIWQFTSCSYYWAENSCVMEDASFYEKTSILYLIQLINKLADKYL